MYSKYISIIHRLGDIILLNISFITCYIILFGIPDNYVTSQYFSLQLYLNLTWIITSHVLNTYNIYRVTRITNVINNFFRLFVIHFLLTGALIGFTESILYSTPFLLLTYLFILLSIPLWRIVLIFSLKAYRKSGYNYRNVIIAGYDEIGKDLREFFIEHPEHGYRFMGFFDDRVENNSQVLGNINDIKDYAVKNDVDEIYCSIPELKNEQIAELIDYADNNLIRIKFLPQSKGFNYRKLKIDFYDHLPVLLLRPIPLDEPVNKIMKRSFDIFFSLIVIIFLLSWLIPLFAIMIKADSRGPVFLNKRDLA